MVVAEADGSDIGAGGAGGAGGGSVGDFVVGTNVVGDAVVGAAVVGDSVVGAAVVGATVVGAAVVGDGVGYAVGDAVRCSQTYPRLQAGGFARVNAKSLWPHLITDIAACQLQTLPW